MYHCAFKKKDKESERLANKLEITSDLLKSTQTFLQESNLQICKLQRELNVSPLSCCMEGNVLVLMEEHHGEEKHGEGSYLQMFVKSHDEEYFGQAHVGIHNSIEELLAIENIDEDIPSESTRKYDLLFMDWVKKIS